MKLRLSRHYEDGAKSLPLRGAWIEIGRNAKAYPLIIVAPLAGGVD